MNKYMNKWLDVTRQELSVIHIRLLLVKLLTFFVPLYAGARWRTFILRLFGFNIDSGTLLYQIPTMNGSADKNFYKNLIIGQQVRINVGCTFDLGGEISIGDQVSIGQQVLIITTTHELGDSSRRASNYKMIKPVTIKHGVWLGARCTIMPGITVGESAIVATGAVVTKDVPPNTIVGGVPAKVLRHLTPASDEPVTQVPPSINGM